MNTRELECVTCAKVRVFEQPPCVDGHGADCDEWVCTHCGAALLVGASPIMFEHRQVVRLRRAA